MGGWAATTTTVETSSCCYWGTRGVHDAEHIWAPNEKKSRRASALGLRRPSNSKSSPHIVSHRRPFRHQAPFSPKNTFPEDRLASHGGGLAVLFLGWKAVQKKQTNK